MSWGGILERIQIDAVELLSNPVDSSKLDRKYILALASLLDEEVAMQVLQNRKQAGWCTSWLCGLTKNFGLQHQQLREQTQQACIQLEQIMMTTENNNSNNNRDRGNQTTNDDATVMNAAMKKSTAANQASIQQQQQTLLLLLKTSYCCSDRCKATLKILIQRSRDFDPASPEVAQALFKIFPNAEKGLSSFVAATSSADGDIIPTISKNNQNNSNNNSNPAPETSSFQIKEKGTIAGSGNVHGKQQQQPATMVMKMNMQMTSDGVLSLFGGGGGAGANSHQQRPAANSLLFSALDPRISVVVLADLLLPTYLKQKWTLQFARLRVNGHPVQKQLQQRWLDFCFNNNNSSSSNTKAVDDFLRKCENYYSSQPPNALEILMERHENSASAGGNTKILSNPHQNNNKHNTNQQEEVIKNENSRFRARTMAYDILTSLILEETKRAALLLRFETELPTDFREKIEEFTELSALPIPIPYEDSKDTWLLFVVMLFIVNGLTDPRFAALFLDNASAVKDVFEAFCILDSSSSSTTGRGIEMLEAFLII